MRAHTQALGLAIAIATLGAAATAGGPAKAQEPRRGGTLVYAVLGDPPTIDCHAASSFATMHYVSPHYSLLIKIDPNDPSKVRFRTWPSRGPCPTTSRRCPT